ncbi:MAG: branched-chain amino acid transporter permease [Oscillospiraceae bacterium]|nr:branched-chain amino acid transporter permease [Oscillospiraceae bacterium]
MALTPVQALASILVMAAITFLTRLLPFLLFDRGEAPPKFVLYLGKVLPPAIISMLIVYCLRNISVVRYPYGLPELISAAVVAILHIWKKNNLLSIFGGTAVYMVLIQLVFV